MGEAIAQAIPFGLLVALSPFPIIGVVLILASPGGLRRAAAFMAGSVGAVTVVTGLIIAAESKAETAEDGETATWAALLKVALAAALLLLAARKWSHRPHAGEGDPDMPGWMRAVEGLTAPKALLAGAALSGVNPKNLVMVAAAATSIAATAPSTGALVVAGLVFVALASLGVVGPVAASALLGQRAAPGLEAIRVWMLRHNAVISVVIVTLIALNLLRDAIPALLG